MSKVEYAQLVESFLRDKWAHYTYDSAEPIRDDRLWWFKVSSDVNNQVILFALGATLPVARTRLESTLRILYPTPLHLIEYESGPCLSFPKAFGPICRTHGDYMVPERATWWGHLVFWRCGVHECRQKRFTFERKAWPSHAGYSVAGAGSPFDIAEQGKW